MLIDEERRWLATFLLEKLTLPQIRTLLDTAGHPYDRVAPVGFPLPDSLTHIVREASDKGWDLTLVESLRDYVNTAFDEIPRAAILPTLAELRQNIISRQGPIAGLPHPFAALFVRNKLPFVNRPEVRRALESLRQPDELRILLLSGPPDAGKTYTSNLPIHAMNTDGEGRFKVFPLDLANETLKGFTAKRFIEQVLLKWESQAAIPEQYQQITSYAPELAIWLLNQLPPNQTWWLIVDGIGKITPDPGLITFLQELARQIANTDKPVRLVLADFGQKHPLPEEAEFVKEEVTLQPLTCDDVVNYFFKLAYESNSAAGAAPFDPQVYKHRAQLAITQGTIEVEGVPRLKRLHLALRTAATELGWV